MCKKFFILFLFRTENQFEQERIALKINKMIFIFSNRGMTSQNNNFLHV